MASTRQSSFLLSAADVSWGRRHCLQVEVGSGEFDAGQYFTVYVPSADFASEAGYYIWADDGVAVDPAPASLTGIAADISAATTEADKAQAIADAVEANAAFRGKVDGNNSTIAIVEAQFKGPITTAAADVDSFVDISVAREGLGGDLGRTSGGVQVTMEAQSAIVKTDQTGDLILDEFFTGSSVEATMSLLEMTPERWELIVGSVTGDTYTPSGGSQLTGYGESRLYQSFFDLGGELVLHPTRFDASDRSSDITFWKSVPKPVSINFSGEEAQAMEVTFTALADRDVKESINLMAFGDASQDVRA